MRDILKAIDIHFLYSSLAGVYWQFHPIMIKVLTLFKLGSTEIMRFASEETALRLSEKEDSGHQDFLSRFVNQHKANPTAFTEDEIRRGCLSNITAGSDTTAISLRAIFYHMLKRPSTYSKLRAEIDALTAEGKISVPVTYKETLAMPYFQAVLKEALRCHSATGFPLERVTPPEGATINAHFLPHGTVVGINSWVIHNDPTIFGEDVDVFRPERWLVSEAQYRIMDRSFFAFGGGSRTCIGKNISLMEMSKLVPEIVKSYDLTLANPKEEWKTYTHFFVRQEGFMVRLSPRAA